MAERITEWIPIWWYGGNPSIKSLLLNVAVPRGILRDGA